MVTPKFRVSFPHVFEASVNALNTTAKPKFSIVMLFDKNEDLSELKAILREAAKEKWGNKIPQGLRTPFRDGNEKQYDGYEDKIFASATSLQRPGLVDDQVQPIIDQSEFYAGCYARATVVAFAYDTAGNRGVSFGLQNIQKIDDGEPFSGRAKPEDDFTSMGSKKADGADNSDIFGGDDTGKGINSL